ncbi:MAG: hypothetical protein WED34_20005 [Planctomycetales bacterium]
MTPHDDTPPADEPADARDSSDPGSAREPAAVATTLADGAVDDEMPEQRPLTADDVEDEAIRGDFVLRWLVVVLAVIVACTRIDDSATLLHVKTGEYIAAHGWLPPASDVFSYTAADREWVNPSWLLDLLLAGIHAAAGPNGLSIFQVVIAGALFGILVHLGRPGVSTWWGSVCAALALLACHPFLTAHPQIVTLLGLALVLLVLNRWRYGDAPRGVWWLVPIFLLWANLDPWMYVGMLALLAYAAGAEIGAMFDSPGSSGIERRLPLWGAIGASLAATLVNPFGWKVWAAPIWMYRSEYPDLKKYGGPSADNPYLSLFDKALWAPPPYFVVAGVVLVVATLAILALNRRRLDWGHAAMFAVVVVLSAIAVHELAVAAVVCVAVAAVNAQEWYAASFRQTYSVATEELVFTRGGRAATVVAFVAIVFLAVSGRLEGAPDGLGLGFSHELQEGITGLAEDLRQSSPDQRTFNLDLTQADLLIWNGRKVFLDRRLALYRRGGEDLVNLHQSALAALRGRGGPAGWKQPFDRFGVVVAIPRLAGNVPDYDSYVQLHLRPEWQLTHLGSTAAVFHRTDLDAPDIRQFVETNRVNFLRDAFRRENPLQTEARLAAPPSFYARYFDARTERIPNPIQLALHYSTHRPEVRDPRLQIALAYLAIRHANEGLMQDPDCGLGYRILGDSYRFLRHAEAAAVAHPAVQEQRLLRYFQEICAYNQSLLVDPEWIVVHDRLAGAYLEFNRFDLAQRELQARQRETEGQTEKERDRAYRRQRSSLLDSIARRQDEFEQALGELSARNEPVERVAYFAYQSGFLLRAIELLEEHRDELATNPALRLLHSRCLLEAGRLAEASESLDEQWSAFEAQHLQQPADLAALIALARIAQGSYEEPIEIWMSQALAHDQARLPRLLQYLPFVEHPQAWPFAQAQQANLALHFDPLRSAQFRMMVAVARLETGHVDAAAATLRDIVAITPDTPLWTLVRFYHRELTGETLEIAPPSEWIPVTGRNLFAAEDGAVSHRTGPPAPPALPADAVREP